MAREKKTVDDVVSDFAAEIGQQHALLFEERYFDLGLGDASPIEQMMGAALLFCLEHPDAFGGHGGLNTFFCKMPGSFETLNPNAARAGGYGIHISPEFPVGKYRADFFIDFLDWKRRRIYGVIECDGHDYHERTKDQARHDKQRDRYFQSLGIIVLRYTGSEIYRDPMLTAFGALQILAGLAGKKVAGE